MSNRWARLDLGLVAVVVAGALSAAIYATLTVRMSLQEFFPGPGYTIDFKDMLGPDWRENWWLLWSAFGALFLLWGVALSRVGGARDRTV
ncbi:MAG TPA: hypothetical protein VNL92_05775, partial [Dehalococcoidia bacterium]|nr:hypothetical protein [Dehalococcoidia bacterium]